MSLALQKYPFPRGLALRLPRVPNPFQSRYYNQTARAPSSTRCRLAQSLVPVYTRRKPHHIFCNLQCRPIPQFHINFVLIVSPHIGWASSTTPHSTASDPAEEEALLCLEQGTQKLEEGDVEGAKKLYQRSVDIKRNASSLFNLGVTHYHLSSCSSQIDCVAF